MPRTFLITLCILVTLLHTAACAPRSVGLQARSEADARFRRTTSLVSFDQARQAFESGDLTRARKEAEAAIERSDGEARYWSLLGRIELEAGRLERAIKAFESSIERDPSLAEPCYFRGIVYQRWGMVDDAVTDYARAFELDSSRVSYLLAWAELLVAERRLDEAREVLLPKLAYFEHNAAIHELLGDVSALRGEFAAAVRNYERSVAIDPTAPLVAEKLLSSLFSAADWQRCLEGARRLRSAAVAQSDGQTARIPIDAFRLEGRSLAMLGRHAEARAVFAEQVRAYPEDTTGWRDLASASIAVGDLPRAAAAADRLLELAARDATTYVLRGLVAEEMGDLEGAMQWYRRGIAVDPNDADAHAALGLTLNKLGRCIEAEASLRRALAIEPRFALVEQALAMTSNAQGDGAVSD
jgi:tetratricopeptide (TPR) repeat protein